jgi:WD40 repeat protein
MLEPAWVDRTRVVIASGTALGTAFEPGSKSEGTGARVVGFRPVRRPLRPLTARKLLVGHRGRVFDCRFDAQGATLATACEDGTVRLFDASTRVCTRSLRLPGVDDEALRVSWAPTAPTSAPLLASGHATGDVVLWSVRGSGVGESNAPAPSAVGNLAVVCRGERVPRRARRR